MIQPRIENPQENDILIYDGKKWVNIRKADFLGDIDRNLINIREQLENAKMELKRAQNTIIELASIMKGE